MKWRDKERLSDSIRLLRNADGFYKGMVRRLLKGPHKVSVGAFIAV